MPQKGTIDLSAGFVPAAPSTIDLSAGFEEHPPKQPTAAPARQPTPAEQQITQKTQSTPMESSWLRSPLEAAKGALQGLIVDPTVGFYQQAKQKDAEMGGPGNALLGAPEVIYDALHSGEEQSRKLIHDKILSGDPSWIQDVVPLISPQARSIAATAQDDPFRAAGQLGAFLAAPKVGEVANRVIGAPLPNPAETFRSMTRNVVGASEPEMGAAAGKVGEETTANAAKSEGATAKANLANQGEFSDAQAAFNEAHDKWQQESTEGPQKVQEQRAAEQAKQDQRQQLDKESLAHASEHGPALDQTLRNEEAATDEAYAKVKVKGVADPADLAKKMAQGAAEKMRESGPIPSEIQRAISRFTPDEGEGEFPAVQPDISASAYQQLKQDGIFTPAEIEAMEGTGGAEAEPNFENLHSLYSAFGKLASRATDGFREAAYNSARGVVGDAMKKLSDAEGQTEAFNAAQAKYRTMARTFYNRSSPVARALNKYREVVGALPDNPNAAAAAAPFVRQILTEPKNYGYAKQLLSQFPGAPVDSLDAMKGALDQFKSMPSKAKVIPDYVPKPEPRYEPPVPAHTAELTPPPEPFNRSEFIKQQMTKTGERFQHLSPWEVRIATGAGIGAIGEAAAGHPGAGMLTAGAGLLEPAAQYGIGRLLQHPGFQEWVSREPGAGLQAGSATPFNAPGAPPSAPPSSQTGPVSPPAGPGPSPAPPTVPLHEAVMGSIEAARKVSELRQQIGWLGDRMPVERTRLEAELKTAMQEANMAERRLSDEGPPTGMSERRSGRLTPTATMQVPPEIASKIKAAGLVSEGEVMPGTGVYGVHHPDFPRNSFSIKATDTPVDIGRKLAAMRERFGK